ncbi:MAG: sulfur carrier protein ThiS [Kiritimatiellae bacterium]|nr:sulfur carrier protein ThiS [Kiritimatiellia bacterium]
MRLVVNGAAHEHVGDGVLSSLLTEIDADPAHVAVMLNNSIVKRANLSVTKLKAGDLVEIMMFVSGG